MMAPADQIQELDRGLVAINNQEACACSCQAGAVHA